MAQNQLPAESGADKTNMVLILKLKLVIQKVGESTIERVPWRSVPQSLKKLLSAEFKNPSIISNPTHSQKILVSMLESAISDSEQDILEPENPVSLLSTQLDSKNGILLVRMFQPHSWKHFNAEKIGKTIQYNIDNLGADDWMEGNIFVDQNHE
jgi:hypothetical protein